MSNFYHRILVVDDVENMRTLLTQVLASSGDYQIVTAEDGFDALAKMRKAPPDLLISDLKMPNMSGFELLSVVRRRFPQIPTIAITGEFFGPGDPEGMLADALFHKGEYRNEELFARVRELLAQGAIRSPLPKPDLAPVWIPRNGKYYILTCTECLRSFSIPSDEGEGGAHQLPCIHCGATIRFILER